MWNCRRPGMPALAADAASSVDRTARVVNHVGTGVLVACGIGFDHVPVEQREHFVEAGKTVKVGAVEVGVAAVAETDVGGDEVKAGLVVLRDTVAVFVSKKVRV